MLTFYRHNIRCSSCRMTTRSANCEIMHYAHCETKEQSASMLLELKMRVVKMLAKRAATVAEKTLVGIEVSGNVAKVEGQTGLYTVRPTSCTCPAHRFGKGKPCKHIERVKHAVSLAARCWPQQYSLQAWGLPQTPAAQVVIPRVPPRLVA